MKLLVISNVYPTLQHPNYGAFVYNLMQEVAEFHRVVVVSPFKINDTFKSKKPGYGDENCLVIRPNYFSFSNKKIGSIDTGRWSSTNYRKAVLREVNKLRDKPDVIYAHFLANAIPVLDYAKQHAIPLVIASGESSYNSFEKEPIPLRKKMIETADHVICVSKENKEQLIALGFDPNNMTVIPNAVDYEKFQPLNKDACKEKLGISKEKFTVGFIGHYIHRKGPNRIIQALKKLNDPEIQLICAGGEGGLENNNFTLGLGKVPNYQLPEVYNAFDVFVLPTLHEGSCNVIEEAKACGIPIISSKGTSVEEQIDDKIGMLIDPLNIDEIAQAIYEMKTNQKFLSDLRANLIGRRGENSLQNRAQRINRILTEVVEENR